MEVRERLFGATYIRDELSAPNCLHQIVRRRTARLPYIYIATTEQNVAQSVKKQQK